MVKALHKAGIEVILDVVYNHTAEGNHLGPMLSFRGVDNAAYYRLVPDDLRHYMDYTGTGNTLNVMHPSVLRLIMDSLRYWVIDCHVDGFRFDLASALARELYDVDRLTRVLRRHPSGPGALAGQADRRAVGRRPGRLPGRQLPGPVVGVERHLPRHDARLLARRGARRRVRAAPHRLQRPLPGRRPPPVRVDQLHHRPRRLHRCADLVSYNNKHNEANKEDNRDGTDDNRSWNCGVEGPTDDPEINALRARQQRNFLATLLLSQGTPMLLGGDEFGRTQGGNNNGWCQDSEISWFDWSLLETNERPARVHAQADRAAARARGLPPPAVPVRRASRGLRAARRGLVPRGRRADARRGWGGAPPVVGRVPQRRGDRRRPTRAGARCSTSPSCCCSTPITRTTRSRCRRGVRRGVDGRVRHGRRPTPSRRRSSPAGDAARPGPPLAGAAAPRLA